MPKLQLERKLKKTNKGGEPKMICFFEAIFLPPGEGGPGWLL